MARKPITRSNKKSTKAPAPSDSASAINERIKSVFQSPDRLLENIAFLLFLTLITFIPLLFSKDTKSNFILPKVLLMEPYIWLIALLWLSSQVLKGEYRLVKSKLYPFAALYLGVCVLTLYRARPLFEATLELRAWLVAGLGFVVAMNLTRTRARVWAVLSGVSIAAVLEAIWGTAQFLNNDVILGIHDQAIGTTGNSNYLGGMLGMFIIPALAVTIAAWRYAVPRVWGLAAVLAGLALLGVIAIGFKVISTFGLDVKGWDFKSVYYGILVAIVAFPIFGFAMQKWLASRMEHVSTAALIVGIVLIIVVGIGLVYSKCRAGYIGAVVGVIAFGAAWLIRSKASLKTIISAAAAAALVVVLIVGIPWAYNKYSLAGKSSPETGVSSEESQQSPDKYNPVKFAHLEPRSTTGRIVMWKASLPMIRDYPILGTGIGTYPYVYLDYLSESLKGKNLVPILEMIQFTEKPHNAYLQVWSECGSVGLAAFLILLLFYAIESFKDLRDVESPEDRLGLLGITCGQLSLLTTITVSSLLVIAPIREYLWIFLGLQAGWRRAAGGGSDWEWKPDGLKKVVVGSILVALPMSGMIIGAKHSLDYYRANIIWESGIRATDKRQYNESVKLYTSALALTPDEHKLLFYRGSILVKMADEMPEEHEKIRYQQAGLADLERSAEGYSDVNLWSNMGKLFADWGDYKSSLKWYSKAADTGINYSMAHTNVGVVLLALGRSEEAKKELQEGIRAEPGLAWARFNLGLALMKEKKFEQAADEFRTYVQLAPTSADGYNNLGLCLMEMDKVTEALNVFKEALGRSPKHVRAMNNVGAAYYRLGDFESARRQWRQVLEIDPGNLIAKQNLDKLENESPPR